VNKIATPVLIVSDFIQSIDRLSYMNAKEKSAENVYYCFTTAA
jgi:hypothetical protein